MVKGLFKEIIPIYDKMNSIMSLGLHNHWRARCVKMAKFPPNAKILDVGCGTGDFSLQIQRYVKNAHIFGMDVLKDMLCNALNKVAINPIVGDAIFLPFKSETFDGITAGFVLRHIEIKSFFKEAMRVLKPGGKIVILEIFFPKSPFIRFFFNLYLYKVIPFLGRLFRKEDAYLYLGASLKHLPTISTIENIAYKEGFQEVKIKKFAFSAVVFFRFGK